MTHGKPARKLIDRLRSSGLTLVTAESLTGGLIGACLTSIPGSSDVFWGGIVSYGIGAKERLLAVDPALVERYGVVSPETASAMATGALEASAADISIAVTGVAGPGGGSDAVPVGTVCLASARRTPGGVRVLESVTVHIDGSRSRVRSETVRRALDLVLSHLDR